MRTWIVLWLILIGILPAHSAQEGLLDLPEGTGVPLVVRVGIAFVEVNNINENKGTFDATLDIRLRWTDLRLRFAKDATSTGYRDFRNSDADAQKAAMWVPTYDLANMEGEPLRQRFGIRMNYNGEVEMRHRLSGTFKANFGMERFPFDHQNLLIDFRSHKLNNERLSFVLTQSELEFSTPPHDFDVSGWENGPVLMKGQNAEAWYSEKNSGVVAALVVQRDPTSTFGVIFLPLLATLLIPLTVVWLNQAGEGGFKIEAFELTNISIGGLFAVVALNFTIISSFSTLAGSANCVNKLFALNYFALGLSFIVNIALYKFNLVAKWYGETVEAEFYRYLNWAMPALISLIAALIILDAAL